MTSCNLMKMWIMRVNYQIRVSVLGGSYINIMCMALNNKAAMVIDLLDSNCTDGVWGNDYYPFKSKIHALAFMVPGQWYVVLKLGIIVIVCFVNVGRRKP